MNRKVKIPDENGNIEEVDLKDLKEGPIVNDTLSNEIINRIKLVYDELKDYLKDKSLEQFEISFMRDENPLLMVAMWERIVVAFGICKPLFQHNSLPYVFQTLILKTLNALTEEELENPNIQIVTKIYDSIL